MLCHFHSRMSNLNNVFENINNDYTSREKKTK